MTVSTVNSRYGGGRRRPPVSRRMLRRLLCLLASGCSCSPGRCWWRSASPCLLDQHGQAAPTPRTRPARSDDYLVAAIDLERLVVDAETGLRGYVITGRPLFLAADRTTPSSGYAGAKATLACGPPEPTASFPRRRRRSRGRPTLHDRLPAAARGPRAPDDPAASRSYAVTLQGKQRVDDISRTGRPRWTVAGLGARARAPGAPTKSEASHATVEAIVVLVLLTIRHALLGDVPGPTWCLARSGPAGASERTVASAAPEPAADRAAGDPGL